VIPAAAVVAVLLLVPIGQAFYYSMTNWNGVSSQWVGPGTYLTTFKNPLFWRVLENNAILLLAVPVTLACGMLLAALLNEKVFGWRIFRAAIIIPTAVSWVVLGTVGIQAFAQNGMLNNLLGSLGLHFLEHNWLGSPLSALIAVAITFVYSLVGVNTLIFVTGMATIDPSIYEAARMDGASWWQSFIRLTFPLLRRYVVFTFVITSISAFSALFSLIFTMTSGGPNYGTTTIEFFIYEQAFGTGAFGQGALLGVILFVILAGVSLLQLRLLRNGE
jgi:multiple sugar transport system permease protein